MPGAIKLLEASLGGNNTVTRHMMMFGSTWEPRVQQWFHL